MRMLFLTGSMRDAIKQGREKNQGQQEHDRNLILSHSNLGR